METFFKEMRALLSEQELAIFKNEYSKPYYRGVRVNTLKCSEEKLFSMVSGITQNHRTPFCKQGFYIEQGVDFSGNHPLHHAGAVYFQEPSAMSAATVLAAEKGDFVLDLCAAPGGKSTQLAAQLGGTGLIWSNEIVRNRANILLGNMERCGVRNSVISSADPKNLCEKLEGVFDKVLVDAPCSGEGMFRRDRGAFEEWSVEHVRSCAVRQLKILDSAAKAVRTGGTLVYSTCTFSEEENEGVIEAFLHSHPEFELVDCEESFGRRTLSGLACRIYPMDGGEGHFAAKLVKSGDNSFGRGFAEQAACTADKKIPTMVKEFLADNFYDLKDYKKILINGENVYILPDGCPDISGVGVVRAGIYAGVIKKNYFEPNHGLFMTADICNLKRVVDFDLGDERLIRFLKGEEIPVSAELKGYTAVAVNGIITGFGKVSSGRLKNKYPKGLRIL